MKLGLGTVQFGLDYGITNRNGRPSQQEVQAMLAHATDRGVDLLDTAALYGDAESVLGIALPRPHRFRIITKTRPLNAALSPDDALADVVEGIDKSLANLQEQTLYGLLVHRPNDLLGPQGDDLFCALAGQKQAGRITKIGVSVYTADEAEEIAERHAIDLIQLPLNPLDQRMVQSGTLARLKHRGIEIHVRSAFLQGLLLSPVSQLPASLTGLEGRLNAWYELLDALGLSPLTAALGFLKGLGLVDAVICGASTAAEWAEITSAHAEAPALPPERLKELSVRDDKLIDPRYWPSNR